MVIEESGLRFEFSEGCTAIKFDDTNFYRKAFNNLPGSKGVDFLVNGSRFFAFVEIKNCTGDEGNCNWRVHPNNSKVGYAPTSVDIKDRDSLDIEVGQKVAMTLAALLGINSYGDKKKDTCELMEYSKALFTDSFSEDEKKILVILFLEGEFGSYTRSKKMIMKQIQESINKKLQWLKCYVSVVDSSTYKTDIFQSINQVSP